jgi:Beta-propeller repeat
MPSPRARAAGLLGLALLVALLPAATTRAAWTASSAVSPVYALPAGLLMGRSSAGPGELPLGWTTFLGGKASDGGYDIALDRQGNAYVTGATSSTDFPVTGSAAQPKYAGGDQDGGDAFVASYDGQGGLRWATYLGGRRGDGGIGIATNGRGTVYLTGWTVSADFPATPGAAQPRYGGGSVSGDAFAVDYSGQDHLRWATFLGGSGEDEGDAVATDAQGNVYVTGYTSSRDFPVTPGATQSHYGGGLASPFVASYDRSGHLRWATYVGGSGDGYGYGIATDKHGNVYVTGDTNAIDFPVTASAAQAHLAGNVNAFVVSYDSTWRERWATYLDGSGHDYGSGIAVDGQGTVYVAGRTASGDFPVTPGAAQSIYGGGIGFGGDAFVASYDGSGQRRWATYLGGSGDDEGSGIATDGRGTI